jgi:sigma-B regulation protein RsbU (phosphoserine phosphatase)
MATVRAAVRAAARHESPAASLEVAARALETDLDRSGSFAALFHARLDLDARRLVYADAGHGYAFVRQPDGTPHRLGVRGLPLGVLPDATYRSGAVTLEPGASLVVYSDGLVDSRPGAPLDPPALAAALDGAGSASEMVHRLIDLAQLTGPPADDLTALVLRCHAAR